jgi:hypothetical protein
VLIAGSARLRLPTHDVSSCVEYITNKSIYLYLIGTY